MKKLPPKRRPPPYEDPARKEAYRAGYLFWPDDTYSPDPGHKYEAEWMLGWAHACIDHSGQSRRRQVEEGRG